MRIGVGFCCALCLLATGLFAQPHGGGGRPPVVVGTFGSVVNPAGGAGTPGVTRTFGSVVNPAGGGVHLVIPGQNRGVSTVAPRNRAVYAYPVYVGGYYDNSYISPQEPVAPTPVQPNVTVVMSPQTPVTPVIINNYYGTSSANPDVTRDQVQPAADEATPVTEPSHYLIAFRDRTIYAATAYWVEGDTLHYFTSGNTHNQVSLSLVDRQFTERLNKEAGVDVKLPAPGK